MIDPRLVRTKLEECQVYLRRLEPLSRMPYSKFRADYLVFNAAERLIQLVVDTAVDVNNHLILESGAMAPRDYYSSFTGLEAIGVLPRRLATSLARTAGLRNRLVHAYEEVDLRVLHGGLARFVADYERYVAAIRRHAGV